MPRGKKGAGVRYERAIRKELERQGVDFGHGLWIEFEDRNGKGFAQPDFIVYESTERWLVVEAKLSQTPLAFEQLHELYIPLLAHLHPGVELVPVQACKVLRPSNACIIERLADARPGAVWHWLS